MTQDQKTVAIGAASGIATMLVSVWILQEVLPGPATTNPIAYALSWNAFAALPLFFMLAAIGNARFKSEAIDPTRGKESPRMIVDGRVAENTLQQFALFAVATLALAVNLPPDRLNIVGAAAIVFVAMRLAFWIGYRIEPVYRAFGFAGTAYLNLGLLAASLWLAVA
jgi:uncharacterized MAPEG superfamily protein